MLRFFLFLHRKVCCRYSLEVPWKGASNEYPLIYEPAHSKTYRLVWPAKTQFSLCICAVWSESLLIMCFLQPPGYLKKDNRDPCQLLGRCTGLSELVTQVLLQVLSCTGSYVFMEKYEIHNVHTTSYKGLKHHAIQSESQIATFRIKFNHINPCGTFCVISQRKREMDKIASKRRKRGGWGKTANDSAETEEVLTSHQQQCAGL